MLGALYRTLSHAAPPLLRLVLARRRIRGQEDAARIAEREGRATRPRPRGGLAWIHGASVGETLSALPLIEAMLARDAALQVLVTSGTVSSARLLAERLPLRALHQFAPLDAAPWVNRFLDHWRPDLAIWLESELWPNMIAAAKSRGAPLLLVNGRMSERALRGWRRFPRLARTLVGAFDLVLAQSEPHARRFAALGAPHVRAPGNLKFAAAPLPADGAALASLRAQIGARSVWLAASVHPGEEAIAAAAHRRVRDRIGDALAILVPRHPHKAGAMHEAVARMGFAVARRSAGAAVSPGTAVYLADTLGELGLFYRLADIALVGGSLVPHGGQNPLEPAALGCPVLHGPHMDNFADAVAALAAAGGARPVADADELAAALAELLADRGRRMRMAEGAARAAAAEAGVLGRIMAEIAPFLPTSHEARRHAPA